MKVDSPDQNKKIKDRKMKEEDSTSKKAVPSIFLLLFFSVLESFCLSWYQCSSVVKFEI